MPEVLFLSPYRQLSQIAEGIFKNKDISYDIIDVPPLMAEEIARKIDKNTKVIVSRGGIAKLAKDHTSIPVIEIPVTMIDIQQAFNGIDSSLQGKKAIITASNIIYNPKFISKIKNLNVDFISSPNWQDEKIQSEELAKLGGYEVIIGDALSHMIAKRFGIESILIGSSEESLSQAIDEALRIISKYRLEHQRQIKSRKEILEKGWVAQYSFKDILGHSHSITRAVRLAKKFAKLDGNVLIQGETGTGKELFAQSIHNQSDRIYGPFVSVNCSALSDSLFESELFGYDSGAFTGASKGGKKGLFECANEGTIFLDEISEISLNLQAKLLRVLQEKKVRRVGSEKVVDIDVRIICAANKNLLDMVEAGGFRSDLYYRLNELELFIPALRERTEDIMMLCEDLLQKESDKVNRNFWWKDQSVFDPIINYPWSGNVRELRNFIVKLVNYSETPEITSEYIKGILNSNSKRTNADKVPEISIKVSRDLKIMEREIFRELLSLYEGDKERLCTEYGISKITLWRKLNYKNERLFQI